MNKKKAHSPLAAKANTEGDRWNHGSYKRRFTRIVRGGNQTIRLKFGGGLFVGEVPDARRCIGFDLIIVRAALLLIVFLHEVRPFLVIIYDPRHALGKGIANIRFDGLRAGFSTGIRWRRVAQHHCIGNSIHYF